MTEDFSKKDNDQSATESNKYQTPTRVKSIKAYGECEVGLKFGEPTLLEKTMLGVCIGANGEEIYPQTPPVEKTMKLTDAQRTVIAGDKELTVDELKAKYGGEDGEHPVIMRVNFEADRKLMFGKPYYWRYVETAILLINRRVILLG